MSDNSKEKLIGENKPLLEQIEILEKILLQNKILKQVLTILSESNLTNYYIGAGAINQTVFNYYHDYDLDYGIKDFDIVYFDLDTSYEKEDEVIQYVKALLKDIPIEYDIKNEARVPIWYPEKYGKSIEPYKNVEDAISSWGTSVTCIGVRLENGKLVVCAPYGLNDIFSMTIRPIKKQFTRAPYLVKTKSWKQKWPLLTILPWNDENEGDR